MTNTLTDQERIWQVVSMIPSGKVATYGQVAHMAELPKAARLVGRVLSQLPEGTRLPWHRVINAQGKISFPEDSHGWQMQKDRLEREGVVFLHGKVDLQRYGYRGAVDRLLWGADES